MTETRRKRLAKLKRTLGENIPAELVIPTPRATYSRRASPLEGPSAALAPFPLMSAPQTQAEYDRPYQTMHMPVHAHAQVKPPPRTQKTYPPALAYAMPTSLSPARSSSSPRQRSVSVDFKRGGFGFAASAPVTPHRDPSPKLKSKPKAQAHLQPQQQQIRRAPSLSARHPPAWSPPRRVDSPDSGPGSGSESGHGRGDKNGKGWATGGTSWMGEWNRKDIHEVQRQLRNLKLR